MRRWAARHASARARTEARSSKGAGGEGEGVEGKGEGKSDGGGACETHAVKVTRVKTIRGRTGLVVARPWRAAKWTGRRQRTSALDWKEGQESHEPSRREGVGRADLPRWLARGLGRRTDRGRTGDGRRVGSHRRGHALGRRSIRRERRGGAARLGGRVLRHAGRGPEAGRRPVDPTRRRDPRVDRSRGRRDSALGPPADGFRRQRLLRGRGAGIASVWGDPP